MTRKEQRWDLGFPIERSISHWQQRHDAGEVPGRWPYGLDRLSAFADVRPLGLPQPGVLARARARLGAGPAPVNDAIGVTWDENAAWRMSTVAPHEAHVSGVIWLTDAAARGQDVSSLVRTLSACKELWVLSAAQVEPLRALVPVTRVDYVRFSIDHHFFTHRPPPAGLRVVSVGGDRDRDAATLYRALEIIHDAMPEVDLIVQTTSQLAPPASVKVVRHLPHSELRELYASATLVMIATRQNLHVSGMTVSLESMSTGRPVVATRTPGMDDYISEGRTGMLSPVGDAEALARGALDLLRDRERAAAMGDAARHDVEARFTSENMAGQIAGLITV